MSAPGRPTAGDRLWHLDWIRAGAMLLGIPYHAGLIYTPGFDWFVASPQGNEAIAAVTGLLGSMRMGLFFWVAGLLTAIVLAHRDPRSWLRRRFLRLGLPLLTATLLISPIVMAAIAYRIARDGEREMAAVFLDLISTPGTHWVGHLWFLQTLLVFSILAVAFRAPLARLADASARWAGEGVGLRQVLLIAALIGFWRLGVNGGWYLVQLHATPGPALAMLKIEPTVDYAPFFLLGMAMRDMRPPRLERDLAAWVILGAAAVVYVAVWREPDLAAKIARYGAAGLLGILGGGMVIALTARLARRRRAAVDALVAASFTLYLVHYPIIVWTGTLLQPVPLPPLVQYGLCILVALVGARLVHGAIAASPTALLLFNGASTTVGNGANRSLRPRSRQTMETDR
ncbi:MAG: acyltransferase family protein [Pseudomonadota bacterium]